MRHRRNGRPPRALLDAACDWLLGAAGPLPSQPDADADGVADGQDNCPDDFNAAQEDEDLDQIGDACDPYPHDANHERAQCLAERDQCEADLALARSQSDSLQGALAQTEAELQDCLEQPAGDGGWADADADGEHDRTDACPATPSAERVDAAGCSLAQFCAAIDARWTRGAFLCELADWRADEPLRHADDCRMLKRRSHRTCVPND
jgi:hypothetical protein